MKRILVVVAAFTALAPIAASAQERMSDARYLAANRCLAYADLEQLQNDGADFSGLRAATEFGNRERTITARVRQDTRTIRARATSASVEELRERRDQACASFAERGLVQLGGSNAS